MEYNNERATAFINLDAVCDNVRQVKKTLPPNTRICAVVKAGGYGHGAVPVAMAVSKLVDFFAVATIDEAIKLRKHHINNPVLLLGYIPEGRYEDLFTYGLRPSVYSIEMAEKLSEVSQSLKKDITIHLKIDSGMNRLGFQINENTLKEFSKIQQLPGVVCEGIFSHFISADESDKTRAVLQIKLFKDFLARLKALGIDFAVKHMSASAGTIEMDAAFDMIRLGISLYGLYPSAEVNRECIKLTPALSIKSRIAMLKTIPAGSTVSYGAAFTAEKDIKIATICMGYGDGYPRRLSNKGIVLINGKRAPIVGRVCMDYLMVDVTGIDGVNEHGEATVVGREGTDEITVDELAESAGIINYEFICNINKRVVRTYWLNKRLVGIENYLSEEFTIDL